MLPMQDPSVTARERRLVYYSSQLASPEPHVIVPMIFRYPPGMGPDGRFEHSRQWPDEEVDVLLSMTAYNRTASRAKAA